MQAHKDILAAFKEIGEAHRQQVIDAQWKEMKKGSAGIPDDVIRLGWPKPAIQLVAHFHHAGDSFGWSRIKYYQDEGGPDPVQLWLAWMKLLASKPEKNGLWKVSKLPHEAELRKWGSGSVLPLLENTSEVKATAEQLAEADFLTGHIAMVLTKARGGWYIFPKLTPEQEAKLGAGSPDREFFKQINGLSMTDLLDALAARRKDVDRWTDPNVPDYRLMAAPETDEERIWWAMGVVKNRRVPAKPEPRVPDDQVTEARDWLAAHKK